MSAIKRSSVLRKIRSKYADLLTIDISNREEEWFQVLMCLTLGHKSDHSNPNGLEWDCHQLCFCEHGPSYMTLLDCRDDHAQLKYSFAYIMHIRHTYARVTIIAVPSMITDGDMSLHANDIEAHDLIYAMTRRMIGGPYLQ